MIFIKWKKKKMSKKKNQALKYWRRALYSGIRRANRWMWFSFFSNMFWMILVAVILFENGGE